jgi:hypothetical protein
MLSVTLFIVMLSVIVLSVVMLSVVAPSAKIFNHSFKICLIKSRSLHYIFFTPVINSVQ